MASFEEVSKLSSGELGDLEELEPLVLQQRAESSLQSGHCAQFQPPHFAVHNEMYVNKNSLRLLTEQLNINVEIEGKEHSLTTRQRHVGTDISSSASSSPLASSHKAEEVHSDEGVDESVIQELLSQLPSSKWRLTSVDAILDHQKKVRTSLDRSDTCDAMFYDDADQANLETLRELSEPIQEKRRRMEKLAVQREDRRSDTRKKHFRLRQLNCDNFARRLNVFGKLMRRVQAESGGAMVAFFKLLMMLLVFNLVTGILFLSSVVVPTKLRLKEKNMSDLMLDLGAYPAEPPRTDLAILLTVGFVFFGSFVYLVIATGFWFRTGNIWLGSSQMIINLTFKGWDCSIASKRGAKIEKKLLVKTISDVQEEDRSRAERNSQRTFRGKLIRLVIHLLIIGLVSGEWFFIYLIVNDDRSIMQTNGDLIITIVLVFFSKFSNLLFRSLAKFEKQSNRNVTLLSVLRNLCIYLVSVLILVETELVKEVDGDLCWEKRLADRIWKQIIYKTIMEIALEILRTLLKLSINCIKSKIKRTSLKTSVVYKVDDRVLMVVKLQALSWIGMILCPAVPLITAGCLATLFFFCIVKVLVVRPRPEHSFISTNTSTLFVAALFVTLLLCMVPVIQIILTKQSLLDCSPFSQHKVWIETFARHGTSNTTGTLEDLAAAASTQATNGNSSYWLGVIVIVVLAVQVLALVYFVAQAKARLLKVLTLGIKLKSLCYFRRKLISKYTRSAVSKPKT